MGLIESFFPGLVLRRERTRREIAQEIAARKAANIIAEGIPTFAKDADEDQWTGLGTGREPLDYDEHDLSQMYETALELSYHPGARGLLETMESFVIGESMYVIAEDEMPAVQDYWDQWTEINSWDQRAKEVFRRVLRDGETFLRWFPPRRSNGSTPHLLQRFIEPNEIKDPANFNGWGHHSFGIETDPDDIEKVLYYYRNYGKRSAGGLAVADTWERIPAADIDHFKIMVDCNVKRGRSWLVGVGKYIVLHEQWLDQRWQLNRLRNLFAVIGNVTGQGGSSISQLKNQFTDTTGKTATGEGTPKKMPKNALWLLSRGVEYDLKSLNINATDAAEDGRNIQLLVAVGTGLAEYVVRADASNSNFASTMVSECPMVRMFQKYQDLWRYMQSMIYARIIRYGISSGALPATSTRTAEGRRRLAQTSLRLAMQEGRHVKAARIAARLREQENQDRPAEEVVPTSLKCQVEFPPLIHRDVKEETEALALQRLQGWVSDQTCASQLGYDYEREQGEINKADTAMQQAAKNQDRQQW